MDNLFSDFYNYEGFGPEIASRKVPEASYLKYQNKLPHQLLQYWHDYGWCGWGKGLYWTVDPEAWDDVLEAWIGDTPFMEQDAYHVIGRNAFGGLYLWGEKTGASLHINSPWGMIYPDFDPVTFAERGADFSVRLFFSCMSRSGKDLNDIHEKPLFERALKKLGPLDHDTMYGFVPALSISGEPKLENLQKLDALVHLEILAQLTPKKIMLDINKLARESDA
jgi:hypothetical protein